MSSQERDHPEPGPDKERLAVAEAQRYRGLFLGFTAFFALITVYLLFDKFVLVPGRFKEQRASVEGELKDEIAALQVDYDSRVQLLRTRLETGYEKRIFNLEQASFKLARERDELARQLKEEKEKLSDDRRKAADAEAKLGRLEKQLIAVRAERDRLKDRYAQVADAGDQMLMRHLKSEKQHEVVYDTICKRLVDLRKGLPPRTPKDVGESINRIIKRIRDSQTEIKKPR